jgi:hypothetical protein
MLRILKGLPIAESELYKRRNTLLKVAKGARRSTTLSSYIRKRNIEGNQSSVDYNAPVFSSSTISHWATRRRLLPLCKSEMVKEDQNTEFR